VGRQLGALIVARHEALAVGELQQAAFAAHRLRDEERLGVRVEEAGGVELDELHVRHGRARAPAHGDAIAGGDVGVGREEIHLAGAARGKHREARGEGANRARLAIEHVRAPDPIQSLGIAQLARGDQVDRDVPLEHVDVRVGLDLPDERLLHRAARRVRGMDDAPVAMAALAGEVQVVGVGAVAGEGDALGHEPLDRAPAALDHEADGVVVAQARPGDVSVADVVL
jgi:hypothetical protein